MGLVLVICDYSGTGKRLLSLTFSDLTKIQEGRGVCHMDVLNEVENQKVKKSICAVADTFSLKELARRFKLSGVAEGIVKGSSMSAIKQSICAVADLVPLDTLVQRFELPKEEILKILHEAGILPLL